MKEKVIVVTKLDAPKSGYQEKTGSMWVVLGLQRGMYQRKVDLDMLNAVKIKLAGVSSVSPSSEQRWDCGLGMNL